MLTPAYSLSDTPTEACLESLGGFGLKWPKDVGPGLPVALKHSIAYVGALHIGEVSNRENAEIDADCIRPAKFRSGNAMD